MKALALLGKVVFLVLVAIGVFLLGYRGCFDKPYVPPPKWEEAEYIKNQNKINATNLELHQHYGGRIADLEARVRHLEGGDRLNKPIVPPPGIAGPVEVLPFPKEK